MTLELLKNTGLPQGRGRSDSFRINSLIFYPKVVISVPFRNKKLPLQNHWKSDYFVTFLTIVQKKKREKDLKAKRQMRKAKNTDKIASHHLAIFCIFKQITYYFLACHNWVKYLLKDHYLNVSALIFSREISNR